MSTIGSVLVVVALVSLDVRVTYVPDSDRPIPAILACDEVMLRVPREIAIRKDGYPDLPKLQAYVRTHAEDLPPPRCAS